MARGDELARRLSDRMRSAPPKGRVTASRTPPASPAETDTARSETKAARRGGDRAPARPVSDPVRPKRGAPGTARRGHLVPHRVHAAASRRKAELRLDRGRRVTWDDVMIDGLPLLTRTSIRSVLGVVADGFMATERPRLVQATLPAEVEWGFVALHLDLGDDGELGPTCEQLWSAAILLWLRDNAWPA